MTRELRRFAAECGDVEMVYLPRGSPYLNPVEACQHRSMALSSGAARRTEGHRRAAGEEHDA